MRRRRRRSSLCSHSHGFALRASPAVKHRVSPLGTVGENEGYSAQFHPCISSMLLRILSLSTSPIVTLSHSLWYVCFCGYPHCTSYASTSTQSNASGGGAPCVTAGDTRAKRGGTRGGSGQRTLRRRRRRTESVEGVTQTCRSGLLCDTAGVGGLRCCLSTGSPFGHHPRLSMWGVPAGDSG